MDDCGDVPAYLCSVEDTLIGEITVSLLRSNGIPVMKRRRGVGEYLIIYMGMSIYDVDLYVPTRLHERASEILAAKPVFEQEDILNDRPIEAERKYKICRLVAAWTTICFAPIPGLIWQLMGIILRLMENSG